MSEALLVPLALASVLALLRFQRTSDWSSLLLLSATLSAAGAVYVFEQQSGEWRQRAVFKASNADQTDFFGTAVAHWGDNILAGAPREDSASRGLDGKESGNDADASGAAYLFTGAGSTWQQSAFIKTSNSDSGDEMGRVVAIWGDTVVVASPVEDGAGGLPGSNALAQSGAVYLLR